MALDKIIRSIVIKDADGNSDITIPIGTEADLVIFDEDVGGDGTYKGATLDPILVEKFMGKANIDRYTNNGIALGKKDESKLGLNAIAIGNETEASGDYSQAFGDSTSASEHHSYAEGLSTAATASGAHAEGHNTSANGIASHAEGYGVKAIGSYSHAEGSSTIAEGFGSHAEGLSASAVACASHAEGHNTIASGESAHAEGKEVEASGSNSHAEGYGVKARGLGSHAEGYNTEANGDYSHTEGYNTIATGLSSHAGGYESKSTQPFSFAHGSNLITSSINQFVIGQYNEEDSTKIFIVGTGKNLENCKNSLTVDFDGNTNIHGNLNLPNNASINGNLNMTGNLSVNKFAPQQRKSVIVGENLKAPNDGGYVVYTRIGNLCFLQGYTIVTNTLESDLRQWHFTITGLEEFSNLKTYPKTKIYYNGIMTSGSEDDLKFLGNYIAILSPEGGINFVLPEALSWKAGEQRTFSLNFIWVCKEDF